MRMDGLYARPARTSPHTGSAGCAIAHRGPQEGYSCTEVGLGFTEGVAREEFSTLAHFLPWPRGATRISFMCNPWAARAADAAPRSQDTYDWSVVALFHSREGL